MKYYLKKSLFLIVYLLFTATIAASILSIEGLAVLKLILLIANLALFLYISCGITFQDGQKAYKVLVSNDKLRERIVETGEEITLNTKEEYHVKKGFIIGALACVPMVLLLIVHAIVTNSNPENIVFGQAAGVLYMNVYGFFNVDFLNVQSVVLYASFYWALLAIPLLIVAQGVSYYLGARKIMFQQEQIKNTHQRIYGK